MRKLLLTAAALGSGWALPAPAPIAPPIAQMMRLPRRISDRGSVAITFDDGPHPEGTAAVLAILAGAGVSATFFLVGEQVRRDPALAVPEIQTLAMSTFGTAMTLAVVIRANRLREAGASVLDRIT